MPRAQSPADKVHVLPKAPKEDARQAGLQPNRERRAAAGSEVRSCVYVCVAGWLAYVGIGVEVCRGVEQQQQLRPAAAAACAEGVSA